VNGDKPRILVVDDQADIRQLLKTLLEVKGYFVDVAAGGRHALDALEALNTPDLVLLDVQMPDMDGWDTLVRIKERFGDRGPRVVMCTVKGHPRDLIHGWASGCDGYVWKPFDMHLLIDEIEHVLARPAAELARVRRTAIGEAQMLLRNLA
jgi:DNA-binding response OmpR family regulator